MKFNQPIDNLPDSLTRILFHRDTAEYDFNQKINKLPKNLKEFWIFHITDLHINDEPCDKIDFINEKIIDYHKRREMYKNY